MERAGSIAQVTDANNIITVKYRSSLVPGHFHGDRFGHSLPDGSLFMPGQTLWWPMEGLWEVVEYLNSKPITAESFKLIDVGQTELNELILGIWQRTGRASEFPKSGFASLELSELIQRHAKLSISPASQTISATTSLSCRHHTQGARTLAVARYAAGFVTALQNSAVARLCVTLVTFRVLPFGSS